MFGNIAIRKILILAANPKNTSRLRLDEEIREIGEGLSRSRHRDCFELIQRWAVRPKDIRRAMLETNPNIVHFSGHGGERDGLIFEDETGQSKFVTGEALAGLFKLFANRLECVVLNGCYSHTQAEIVAQYIPYVIGMQQAVGDKDAIAFAVGFYDALGAGHPFKFAYELGCSAIQMEGTPESSTPIFINVKKPKPSITNSDEYELLVKDLLQSRLVENIPGKDLRIKHNTCFTGRSGYEHQVDISAEMKVAGVRLLILVECKSSAEIVETSEILEFASRIEDIGAHKGIIVTTHGFQSGALQLAKSKGIALIVACDLEWNICAEAVRLDIGFRQRFIHKSMSSLNRTRKVDEERLTALYSQSAECRRAETVHRFARKSMNFKSKRFMGEVSLGYIFLSNDNEDICLTKESPTSRVDSLFTLRRDGIFSHIAIDYAYAIELRFIAKVILSKASNLVEILGWLSLPLPPLNALINTLSILNNFVGSLKREDFKQAFQLLGQIENFDPRRNFEGLDYQYRNWKGIENWGLQEVANALETSNRSLKLILKLAQAEEIKRYYLEPLAIIMADRNCFHAAIELANSCKWFSYPRQERALLLAKIAHRLAKAGDLTKASILIIRCCKMSLTDPDVARSQAGAMLFDLSESRGVSKQTEVLTQISTLVEEVNLTEVLAKVAFAFAGVNLIEQATQLAQSIKSERRQAQVMDEVNRIAHSEI